MDKVEQDNLDHRRRFLESLKVKEPDLLILEQLGRRMAENLELRVLEAFLDPSNEKPPLDVRLATPFRPDLAACHLLADSGPVLTDPGRMMMNTTMGELIPLPLRTEDYLHNPRWNEEGERVENLIKILRSDTPLNGQTLTP